MQPDLDWEFWLDCNLSPIIAKWLNEETGYNFKSAYILGHYGLADVEIYERAKTIPKVILISKDSDIPDLINRYGSPPKLINLRMGNATNRVIYHIISSNLDAALKKLIEENIHIVDLEA